MSQLSSEVTKLMKETKTWVLSTCGEKPNAIPVFFTELRDDALVLYDVFMNKTLDNIKKNSSVTVTVFNDSTLEGYQLKGTATYSADAALVEAGNVMTGKLHLPTKGALVVRIE